MKSRPGADFFILSEKSLVGDGCALGIKLRKEILPPLREPPVKAGQRFF